MDINKVYNIILNEMNINVFENKINNLNIENNRINNKNIKSKINRKNLDKVKNSNNKEENNLENQNNIVKKEELELKEKEKFEKEQQLKNLIYLLIDLEKTYMKIKANLDKQKDFEKYYLINLDWFKEYLKITSTENLFYNKNLNKKIKSVTKQYLNESDEKIFELLISDKDFKQNICLTLDSLKFLNSPIKLPIEPQIGKTKEFNYYSNFILISDKTKNKIISFEKFISPLDCLFGDNFVIILFNNTCAQIYDLKEYKYSIKIILNFYQKRHLKESIELLKEYHLEKYKKYFTLFNDDKASPIFNKNNDEIGTMFLFDNNITDYSTFMLSDVKVRLMKYYCRNYKDLYLTKKLWKAINQEKHYKTRKHLLNIYGKNIYKEKIE